MLISEDTKRRKSGILGHQMLSTEDIALSQCILGLISNSKLHHQKIRTGAHNSRLITSEDPDQGRSHIYRRPAVESERRIYDTARTPDNSL